jgi:hypothetical protein
MKKELVVGANTKRLIRDMVIYLLLGIGCMLGATFLEVGGTWHSTLVFISGVLIGGDGALFAFFLTGISPEKGETASESENKLK